MAENQLIYGFSAIKLSKTGLWHAEKAIVKQNEMETMVYLACCGATW